LREIGQAVGLRSNQTVHYHLGRLEDRGLIRRIPGAVRAIQLLDKRVCPTCGRPREEVNTHDGTEIEHDDRALQPLA
jgi:SOS-response transcriptional repressor LexA